MVSATASASRSSTATARPKPQGTNASRPSGVMATASGPPSTAIVATTVLLAVALIAPEYEAANLWFVLVASVLAAAVAALDPAAAARGGREIHHIALGRLGRAEVRHIGLWRNGLRRGAFGRRGG